jgi:VanZ family protein
MSRKQILFLILAIAWMVLIFYFSAQTAEESTGQSDGVSYIIGNIIYKDFDSWSELRKAEFADSVSSVVRKTAHMIEYGILCFLWFEALGGYSAGMAKYHGPDCDKALEANGSGAGYIKKLAYRISAAFLITVIYAATDEFHQRFVVGRTGKVADVFIDAGGALIVCVILTIVIMVKVHHERSRMKGQKI